jgi:hypothetical protein
MQDQAEAQAAVDAPRDAARPAHPPRHGLEAFAEEGHHVLAGAGAAAEGDGTAGMARGGFRVGGKAGQAFGQVGKSFRQRMQAAAGQKLLVGAILLEAR